MRQYIEFERRNFVSSFHTRSVHNGVLRFISDSEEGSCILHHQFTRGASVARVIEEQVESFKDLRKNFEWKVYATDEPATLAAELIKQGFREGPVESFMVLDLKVAPPELFSTSTHDVRRITADAGVRDAVSVAERVWNEPMEDRFDALATQLHRSPESISIYVVYADDDPVSSAWINFNPTSPFAGLWGGSTVPDHRGRGCYQALLAERAREARARGVKFLTIDASAMSRPIVERFGFEWITDTRPYEWRLRQR
jgi:GNAT superfamily N-acetyltransferase